MLDGELLNKFIMRKAKEHYQKLEAKKLQDSQTAVEFYDIYGFNIFPTVEEYESMISDKPVNPEWQEPHDKWPRDYDNSRKETDEC